MTRTALLFALASVLHGAVLDVCNSGCTYSLPSAAEAAAVCGDIIELRAGQTFTETSPLTIDGFNCTAAAPLIVRSSGYGQMPEGRVVEGSALLASIRLNANFNHIMAIRLANHGIYLQGLDIQTTAGTQTTVFATLQIGYPTENGQPILFKREQWPDNIRIDKSVIRTNLSVSTAGQGIAVYHNARAFEVTNSVIQGYATPASATENQGMLGVFTLGPLLTRNNEMRAGQINFLTGGGGVRHIILGEHPRGLLYQGNYLHRPWAWMVKNTTTDYTGECATNGAGDGEYFYNTATNHTWQCSDAGTWTDLGVGDSAPNPKDLLDKNRGECKNGFGLLLDGNYFQKSSQYTMLNQYGLGFLVNKSDDEFSYCDFITVRNNRFDRLADGIGMGAIVVGNVPSRFRVQNNFFTRLGWGPSIRNTIKSGPLATGMVTVVKGIPITVDRNTALVEGNTSGYGGAFKFFEASLTNAGITNTQVSDNIVNWSSNGFFANIIGGNIWTFGANLDYIDVARTPAGTSTSFIARTVVANDRSVLYGGQPQPRVNIGAQYTNGSSIAYVDPMVCKTCQFPTAMADIGYTTYDTYGKTGNYRLASGSAYKARGTWLRDPGAEIDVVENSTDAVITGAPNPFLDFRIQYIKARATATTAQLRFTAYDTGACSISVADNYAHISPVFTSAGTAGDIDRTVTITGLAAAKPYFVEIACATTKVRREMFYQ